MNADKIRQRYMQSSGIQRDPDMREDGAKMPCAARPKQTDQVCWKVGAYYEIDPTVHLAPTLHPACT